MLVGNTVLLLLFVSGKLLVARVSASFVDVVVAFVI